MNWLKQYFDGSNRTQSYRKSKFQIFFIIKLFDTEKIQIFSIKTVDKMKLFENSFIFRLKNVRHGFQPIYCFSRCIGLWPFTIAYDSNGAIKDARIDLFDCLWFLISICLHLTALYSSYGFMTRTRASEEQHFFSSLIFYINQIPSLLFGAICIVLDMLNRNKLTSILKKFIIFDKQVCFRWYYC